MITYNPPRISHFVCSICEEESTKICVNCTKDTCANHLCEKCASCSDCCSCELSLDTSEMWHPVAATRDPEPHPMPDPDPAPEPEPIPTFPKDW